MITSASGTAILAVVTDMYMRYTVVKSNSMQLIRASATAAPQAEMQNEMTQLNFA